MFSVFMEIDVFPTLIEVPSHHQDFEMGAFLSALSRVSPKSRQMCLHYSIILYLIMSWPTYLLNLLNFRSDVSGLQGAVPFVLGIKLLHRSTGDSAKIHAGSFCHPSTIIALSAPCRPDPSLLKLRRYNT